MRMVINILVYDKNNEVNKEYEKRVENISATIMKIKYGNLGIFLTTPKALIQILANKFYKDDEHQCYKLHLSRFDDTKIIRFVENYKILIDNYNEDALLFCDNDLEYDIHSKSHAMKMCVGKEIIGNEVILTIPIIVIDILNIVKNFALESTKWK